MAWIHWYRDQPSNMAGQRFLFKELLFCLGGMDIQYWAIFASPFVDDLSLPTSA